MHVPKRRSAGKQRRMGFHFSSGNGMSGSKTGTLLPTGNVLDVLDIPGFGRIEVTILDVSNPMVLVRAEDVGATGTELPEEVNNNKELCDLLEKTPKSYLEIGGTKVAAEDMDICARVISVFKCHKACPLTSASAIAVAAALKGSLVQQIMRGQNGAAIENVRIGHPSGIMTMCPEVKVGETVEVSAVAVQRTARRIMDGTLYIRK